MFFKRVNGKCQIIQTYSSGNMYTTWASKQDAGLNPEEKALFSRYGKDHNIKICNMGCGTGRETFALYKMGYRNITGVDACPALLEIAQKRNSDEGLEIRLDLATIDNLPYESNSFDVVTMFENLYGHITPRSMRIQSLKEVCRVLKPGGIAMIVATSLYYRWLYFFYIKAFEYLRMIFNPSGMEKGDKKLNRKSRNKNLKGKQVPRSHWFRPEEIPQDAIEVGLSIVQSTTIKGICQDRKSDSSKYHGQGRLVYVLKYPE